MTNTQPVTVRFRQSQANNLDRHVLEALLTQVPGLSAVDVRAPLLGGYSGCRLYLALATFSKPAPIAWLLKVGPRDEIEAEDKGYLVAKAHVSAPRIIGRVAVCLDKEHGVIIYDYAGFTGRNPIDLDRALQKFQSVESLTSVVQVVEEWSQHPTWSRIHLSQLLKEWTSSKLDQLPDTLISARDLQSINSPDFGEVYANPSYYLARDIPRLEVDCPVSFVHGDLNFHNVLFNVDTDNSIDLKNPLFIDFRHAAQDKVSVLDLAKLESCIRYQTLGKIESLEDLNQRVTFLAATRERLEFRNPPDVITDKRLQDLWRCLQKVRNSAVRLLRSPEAELAYWIPLIAYGISASTYSQLPLEIRHLTYLDTAAIFTKHIQARDTAAVQVVLRAHERLSPPVVSPSSPSFADTYRPMLLRSLERGYAVLVIGGVYGKTAGFEPLNQFVPWLFKDLTSEDAPAVAPETLLEIISRRKPRYEIARAIQSRIGRWGLPKERKDLDGINWAAIINWHFHDDPYRALLPAAKDLIRVDSMEQAVENVDLVKRGSAAYFPLLGDVASIPSALSLTPGDRRERWETLVEIARALELRQHPISIVFWRCESVPIDDLPKIRGNFSSQISVPVDSYFLTDQDDELRDHALAALDIWRVHATLAELKEGLSTPPEEAHGSLRVAWQLNDVIFTLPDIARLSRGLVRPFSDLRAIGVATSDSDDFLLGAPATEDDILDGRIVRRKILDTEILPAIRSLLEGKDRHLRSLLIEGRAGAGVTTLLCLAAHAISKNQWAPVYIAAKPAGTAIEEWSEAGKILGEISKTIHRPVVLFVDATNSSWRDVEVLSNGVLDQGGEIVPILGGRKDLLRALVRDVSPRFYQRIEVADTLSEEEWSSLARILHQNGYSSRLTTEELASRLASVGQLLPAIYQATDKMNRKFREIVAYEYHRYDSDALVQRAYRFVCYLGAFDLNISQYWLLKALGDQRLSDAVRVLGRLSDDIVIYSDETGGKEADILIGPRHRLIAEEVLNIAVPDPHHRLSDLRQLIATANLASFSEGMKIAHLLLHRGPLLTWLAEAFADNRFALKDESLRLYEVALDNQPIYPRVEVTIRQHHALTLRFHRQADDALEEIKRAITMEPNNTATIHIAGLIHVDRALAGWEGFREEKGETQETLSHALGNEQDALEFFRLARRREPTAEYGYEPEARYFNTKLRILRRPGRENDETAKLLEEAELQVASSLSLLRSAEALIPKDQLLESPKTKALLLHSLGDTQQALDIIIEEIKRSADPVRVSRLKRAAASLAAESDQLPLCVSLYEELIATGEHDAATYLLLDNALREQAASLNRRIRWLRESAQSWNRNDIETLMRFAEVLLYDEDWSSAVKMLSRADQLAAGDLSAFQRDHVRSVIKSDGLYGTIDRRFEGRIARLWKPFEGQIELHGKGIGLFFRSTPDLSGKLAVGDKVVFAVGLRIRGLRALGMDRVEE